MATAPGGFKISCYMQEQLCRAGTRMTFEKASEQVTELKGVAVNAKQIERLCHHYGELLGQVDWKQSYTEAIQLRLPLKDELTYAMMDGSMILTRQKNESWKEVKLCRTFRYGDRVEDISKDRNHIGHSDYVAHLGKHMDFFDKVIEVLPTQSPLVFICDGAKWIWKWIEEYYPNSTQILDFYHCKEHLYGFAKIYNETRINYGLYKEQGLLFGSGAIESANRDIIQKRMKLSGQRWTLSGHSKCSI
ncbi:MAG: hypothetical protein LLG05_08165 [Porphyromonadaceae bacterium]|nr:hypothetical protein [Porphyromonadaceae bacterium]